MIDQINHIAEMWWAWMWPMFWQAGVLIGLVAVIDLLIRRRIWPQVRYALWLLVLAKLILPPTFSLSTSFTSGLEPLAEQIVSVRVQSEVGTTLPYIDVSSAPIVIPQHDVQAEPEGPVTPTNRAAPAVQRPKVSAKGWAMCVWLLGVVVLSVWLAARFRQLRRSYTVRGGGTALPRWLSESVAESARKLKLRRLPRIIVSGDIASPAVFGVLRPTLLLPSRHLAKGLEKNTEHVLLHELAHIKRGDLWVHAVYMVLQIVHWFNPLLWLVRRHLQHLRELCCDASVARVLREETSGYRQTILDTARRLLARPVEPGIGLLGLFEDSSRLLIRLKWLEKKTWRYRTLRITIILAVIGFMSVCILPMAEGGPDVQMSAEELVAKIIESEKKIKDIRLNMACTIPAENRTFYEYDWGYEDGKEFYSGIDNTRDSRTNVYRKVEVTRAFDGGKQWQFGNDPKSRPYGGISEPNPNFSIFRTMITFNTLLGFDAKELSRLSLGEALAQAEFLSVRDQTESIDGRACYVIEAINLETDPSSHWRYDVRVWIDYRRDYRPLKFEKYRSIPGKNRFKVISRRVDNIKLKQIDGIWLPIEGERTTFSTNDIHPPEGVTSAQFSTLSTEEREQAGVFKLTPMAPTRRLEIDIDSIRLNKGIPAKTFTIDFPDGCEVYDEFAGRRYVVGEPSEQEATLSDGDWMEQVVDLSVGELIDVLAEAGVGRNNKKWLAAIYRLVEIGSPAVPQLVAEIRQTEKPITQSKLALTLRAIGDANAVPGLIDALERAGFSSDFGLGEPKTELERFYKTHQMDPVRKSMVLGRPVREITIALEELTGHSEGHDHFDAYDSAGNRLGGFTVTPEIRDRERQHRREVAQKWRLWWEANKDNIERVQKVPAPPAEPRPPESKAHEGGILASTEGVQLTLAIVPNIGGSARQPRLTEEEYQTYVEGLAEEGPFAGSIRGDSFQWSPIKGDAGSFKDLPLSTYKDRTYILLCARAQYVMMPEVEGRWIWGLEKVEAASINGAPAINILFDEKGAELLGDLTKANIDSHLAVAVDGWVLTAPAVLAEIRKVATITGDFTTEEARLLVEDLKKGMPTVNQEALKAMREISQAAEKLSKDQLPKMTPRQIVENLLVTGLAGDSEKLAWLFRPESVAAKSITVDDFGQMSDGHKIRVLEVHADANDALAVTSNIKGKSGDDEGRLVFHLSRQTGAWLIHDADIGDPQRVQDDVTRFKNKHPNAKSDSNSQAVDSSQGAILAIIERLRSAEYVRSGKGTATVVKVESRSADQTSSTDERIVDFRFKGDLTRSDAFAFDKGKRGDFIDSWARGPMSSARYSAGGGATIEAEPFGGRHREVGYDFHPETFSLPHLADLIERAAGLPDITLEAGQDAQGRTRIVSKYKDERSEEGFVMLFITDADGIRLSSWESTAKNLEDNSTDTGLGRIQLDWKKYAGAWYISEATLERIGVYRGLRSENRTTVTIREFTPNVEIEDKEFTLDGLNMPPGTTVHDSVLETTYKYAGSKGASAERLRRMGTAILMYANDYEDKAPDNVDQLKRFLDADDMKWLLGNVHYIGKGKSTDDDPEIPLAYDKTMLQANQAKGTHVLSISGIVSFKTREQLKKLGIDDFSWGPEIEGVQAVKVGEEVRGSKTDKAGSAEKWARVLPDGSEVKLVAVFRPKDDPVSFWDPNGNIIPGPRFGRWQYSNLAGRELAVVLEHPQDYDENPDPDGKFYSVYDWREIDSSKPLAVSYYRGYGDWEDFGGLHHGSELSHLDQAYTLANVEDKTLLSHKQILVKMWYGVNPDIGIRLAAVDKEDKKYPMEAADIWIGGDTKGHRTLYYTVAEGLSKDELSHFILQKRPMALVRFSGFATEPKKAAVQVETEAPSEKAGLIWGEAVNGLRAAIEFEPEKRSYSIPEKIDIRFHIQNVSDKPIEFISESYRPEPLEIHDANGNRQGIRENYYSGLPPVTRHHVEPGREVVLRGLPLSIAQDEQQLDSLVDPHGTDFKAKGGVYFVRAKLWISRWLTSGRHGDFKGMLETGKHKLVVTGETE